MPRMNIDHIFNRTIVKANQLRHEYLSLDLLASILLEDLDVIQVLRELDAPVETIQQVLNEYLEKNEFFSVLPLDVIEELSIKQFPDENIRAVAKKNGIYFQPEISKAVNLVLRRAHLQQQSSQKIEIMGIHLFVSMLSEENSYIAELLKSYGVTKIEVIKVIAHGIDGAHNVHNMGPDDFSKGNHSEDPSEGANDSGQFSHQAGKELSPEVFIQEFCRNLNELAKKNKIDPLIGRKSEVDRITQILLRRRKNNPLLVGEAGVGKTAIVEGLAYLIENQSAPDYLKKSVIYSLDVASILSGTKFRGDFEKRFKEIIKAISKIQEKGDVDPILFIDEIHTIMGAGSTGNGSLDISNLLKPYLSRGALKIIGSTTYQEYRKHIEKDQAFKRRFQKIDVDEPNAEDTYKILLGLRSQYEVHHQVKFSDTVLKHMIFLGEK